MDAWKRMRALSHTSPGLCHMQGWGWWEAWQHRSSLGFCAEPGFHALQITARIGEIWGRTALGRDGCMQTFSEMVLGKTGVLMLPEIQKTCSGTDNFLPISFSFPLSFASHQLMPVAHRSRRVRAAAWDWCPALRNHLWSCQAVLPRWAPHQPLSCQRAPRMPPAWPPHLPRQLRHRQPSRAAASARPLRVRKRGKRANRTCIVPPAK